MNLNTVGLVIGIIVMIGVGGAYIYQVIVTESKCTAVLENGSRYEFNPYNCTEICQLHKKPMVINTSLLNQTNP